MVTGEALKYCVHFDIMCIVRETKGLKAKLNHVLITALYNAYSELESLFLLTLLVLLCNMLSVKICVAFQGCRILGMVTGGAFKYCISFNIYIYLSMR